jgi:hypothetical protein
MTDPSAFPAQPASPSDAVSAILTRGGRAGVPVSVWPGVPAPARCPASAQPVPCPQRLSVQAGVHVITAFSRPGDLVVIPEPGTGTLLVAAAAAGRRTLGLVPATGHRHDLATRLDHDLGPACRALARLSPGGPRHLLHAASLDTGQATLAITVACATPGCPPPGGAAGASPDRAAPGADPGLLYAACQRVLAPGGLLVIITNAACQPGHPGGLIAHARAAGLVYTQHIIAVHARIRGSHLITALAGPPGPAAGPARHVPIHTDLLVFTEGGSRP